MTRTETLVDDQRRPYQTSSYEVDQTDGTVTDRLTSNTWYNHRGFQVKTESPNGLFSKTLYDGAGRGVISLTSIDDDETTWSESLDATGDTVIEQSNTIYDPGSRVVAVLAFQRESTSLLPEGTLDASNSYPDASVTWYDRANRVTHAATFGRDDGPTRYVFDATEQKKVSGTFYQCKGQESGTGSLIDTHRNALRRFGKRGYVREKGIRPIIR